MPLWAMQSDLKNDREMGAVSFHDHFFYLPSKSFRLTHSDTFKLVPKLTWVALDSLLSAICQKNGALIKSFPQEFFKILSALTID